MPGGLVALLDDVATMAKLAASSLDDVAGAAGRAGTKAAGVVIDDTAVTPRYVVGLAPERELPIIAKIAVGSLRNKLLVLLPAALLLTAAACSGSLFSLSPSSETSARNIGGSCGTPDACSFTACPRASAASRRASMSRLLSVARWINAC